MDSAVKVDAPHPEPVRRNRLAKETSPYLLQHATNPVDWYAWGEEALARARSEGKPIFLSIGYSACHWCHVMERESFENAEVAELLNRHFVSIKVDREERPDLDEIYMKAVQMLTGSGGWPMSVFLTPDLEPFLGGTYFPPDDRHGRPGFLRLTAWIADLWERDRERLLNQGRALTDEIRSETRIETGGDVDHEVLDRSLEALAASFDPVWGGFGRAPKFPHALDLRLCLRHARRKGEDRALEIATRSLDRMAAGGIYDHLAGGFARYSTDEKWLIPHFEKMLYDNALLVPAYLEAHLVQPTPRYAEVVRETCDWILREMTTPEGGFASSLDADSEGEEGKYYVWTPEELVRVLGPELGARAAEWFGVTSEGNFEHGTSALWRPESAEATPKKLGVPLAELEPEIARARELLLRERSRRIPPGKDDKVLAAWNGLAISALALAYQVLGDVRHLDAARRAARYVLEGMRQPDGRLFATARGGRAHLDAYLDDYAFTIQGLLDLYESDFDASWIREALALNDVLTERFEDEAGGYFTTARDHEALLVRLKSPHDGALPAGNGVQVSNLLRLAELTGETAHAQRAERAIRSVGRLVNAYPQAFSQLLLGVHHLSAGPVEIVLAGEPGSPAFEALLSVVRSTFVPQRVVARAGEDEDSKLLPLLEGKRAPPGQALAFVCRNFTCGMPARTPQELAQNLADL
jgi:uncharacterized protein YyaL (SSP411 family)